MALCTELPLSLRTLRHLSHTGSPRGYFHNKSTPRAYLSIEYFSLSSYAAVKLRHHTHLLRISFFVRDGHRLKGVCLRQRHLPTCIGVHTKSDSFQLEHAMRTSPLQQRAPISQTELERNLTLHRTDTRSSANAHAKHAPWLVRDISNAEGGAP